MPSAGSPQRIALVTGGAKRVGRAIVLKLASTGFDIAFTYLNSPSEAEELAATLRGLGRDCVSIAADLADPIGSSASIDRAVRDRFGRLDLLVNNASIYEPDRAEPANVEQMRRMWSIHVESPLLLCRRFADLLRHSRGRVINMVDLLAERPRPGYLAYCASKAGLRNLTLGLARELAPEVTVNGIAPGAVDWPEDSTAAEQEKYLKRVPLARAGAPEDVAAVVHFLCTAGTYITGQIIRLDGGRSIT